MDISNSHGMDLKGIVLKKNLSSGFAIRWLDSITSLLATSKFLKILYLGSVAEYLGLSVRQWRTNSVDRFSSNEAHIDSAHIHLVLIFATKSINKAITKLFELKHDTHAFS